MYYNLKYKLVQVNNNSPTVTSISNIVKIIKFEWMSIHYSITLEFNS